MLTNAEVAALLSMSLDTWIRRKPMLIRDQGFPPPVALGPCSHRWDRLAIEAWLDLQRPPHLRQAVAPELTVKGGADGLAELQRRLDRNAEAMSV